MVNMPISWRNWTTEAESDSHKYLIGAEYKIADGTSLTITVGDESGDNGSASGTFVLGGLSWSF